MNMNGVFKDDAERDAVIVRIDERQREIYDDIKEIRRKVDEFWNCYNQEVQKLKTEVAQVKVWTGIFSAVFIPIIIYLAQRAIK